MAFVTTIEDGSGKEIVDLYTTHDMYLLPDGTEMFISTQPAWCRACSRFVLVEQLQRPEEMEARAREFARDTLEHPFFPPEKQAVITNEQLAKSLHIARHWRLARQSRKSKPRCLECGGTDYVVLPDDDEWLRDPAIPYDRVRTKDQICHASMRYRGRLFDTRGNRIPGRYAST